MVGRTTPVDGANFTCEESIVVEYLPLSEKNASSAVTRLRRSEIIAVLYALFFVFANFGIAIAARMPMITTTIRSSMRVKPLRSVDIVSFIRVREKCTPKRQCAYPANSRRQV